jgi:hypothetical protein
MQNESDAKTVYFECITDVTLKRNFFIRKAVEVFKSVQNNVTYDTFFWPILDLPMNHFVTLTQIHRPPNPNLR